jgi:hypothetical protein
VHGHGLGFRLVMSCYSFYGWFLIVYQLCFLFDYYLSICLPFSLSIYMVQRNISSSTPSSQPVTSSFSFLLSCASGCPPPPAVRSNVAAVRRGHNGNLNFLKFYNKTKTISVYFPRNRSRKCFSKPCIKISPYAF